MRAADLVARRLAAAGCTRAFGIPGGEVLSLLEALRAAGVEFVTARHETAAGLMAEGAAAHTGAPALLVVTMGPGLSNAVTAAANALLDRVPMIVLSGSAASGDRVPFTHQVFDQVALLAPVTKASLRAEARSLEATIQHALTVALAHPRGPVHVELPMNVLASEDLVPERPAPALGDPEPAFVAKRTAPLEPIDEARGAASEQDTERTARRMAALLASAERPLVLAGLESIQGNAPAALGELLTALDAPLLTTYKAKGVLDEQDPRCVGAIGLSPRADAVAQGLLRTADVVLLVGYDPVEMRAAYVEPFAEGSRVLELAPCVRTHAMHRAELSIATDLSRSLEHVRRSLPSRIRPRWRDGQPAATRSALRALFAPGPGFSPEVVVDALSQAVPPSLRLTVDTGAHRIVFSQAFRARRPGQVLQSNGLCTMGYALPAAIGLALASSEPVLAVMGDGGFDMVAGELATLRDLDLPVTTVIFDDRSLALIDLKQVAQGLPRCGVWSGATDHVAVARAYGGRGTRVHERASLEQALAEALARKRGFSVISCALERGAYEGRL